MDKTGREGASVCERYVFARRGQTLECAVRFDAMPDFPKIERCYRQALDAWLDWMKNVRLQTLIEADAALKGAERKGRLHRSSESWQFVLSSSLTDGRYLSVTLSVKGKGKEINRTFVQRRVWDTERGILCPLAQLICAKKARMYDKWEYSIENGELTVFRRGKARKIKRMNQ